MLYTALIGDIVDSRSETDRSKLQEKLSSVLDTLNRQRGKAIVSPYTLTLGDEFQVLFNSPKDVFGDLWRISEVIYPARARYSIALGNLTTPVNPDQALGMDGPAFHIARSGIEHAKKLKTMFWLGGAIPTLDVINDTLRLISHSARDWNANRLAIEADFIRGKSVKEIAEKVGVSESGVYKNIHAAALETINGLLRGIENAIWKAGEKGS